PAADGLGGPAAERADEQRDPDGEEERERRDLARRREADGETGRGVSSPAGPVLRDAHGAEERRGAEGGEERVDRPEVGQLDAEGAERREPGGEEGGAAAREPARDPID